MTHQQAFDTIYRHFILEGHPPAFEGASCKYRTSDGRRCAGGLLIPDTVYSPEMESDRFMQLVADTPALGFLWPVAQMVLDMQNAHDRWAVSAIDVSTLPMFGEPWQIVPERVELGRRTLAEDFRQIAAWYTLTVPS